MNFKMDKGGFGKLVTLAEAKQVLIKHTTRLPAEKVNIENVLNRILAEDINSSVNVPHFNKSAMDGYAVIAQDTFTATNTNPKKFTVLSTILAGDASLPHIGQGECAGISTGAALPPGADAVVMVEYTEKNNADILVYKPVAPGENVISCGTDIKIGMRVLDKGTKLNPRLTGVLSAIGLTEIAVVKKPQIGLIATGDELINPPTPLSPGKIYDINSRTISDAIRQENGEVYHFGIVKDNYTELKTKINEAIDKTDLLIISGGSSLGTSDIIVDLINELGEVYVHGIAIKPGKPTIIGKIKTKLVIGLPGNPTSALLNFHILVKPILDQMMGWSKRYESTIPAKVTRKIVSTIGRYEFLPVKLTSQSDIRYAEPILRGSNAITSLSLSDGYIEIDNNVEVIEKDDTVIVHIF